MAAWPGLGFYAQPYIVKENDENLNIPSGNSEKELYDIFETDLKFYQHINGFINKANRTVGLICRSFLSVEKKSFKKLYITSVGLALEYCNIILSPSQI